MSVTIALDVRSFQYSDSVLEQDWLYASLPLSAIPPTKRLIAYLNLGTTGLFVTASATHPPISASPPNGVTGPRNLPNLCGSNTSKYKLPENIVIPAVSKPMARVFCGAATEANVSTAEWMSWYCAAVPQFAGNI